MFNGDVVAAQLDMAANGTLVLANTEGSVEGTWTVENGQVIITTDGAAAFTYADGKLVSVENPNDTFVKAQ